MSDEENEVIAGRANKHLPTKYQSFRECVWNAEQKCMIYVFESDKDAEAFKFDQDLVDTKFRREVVPKHQQLTVVIEPRP